MKKKIKYTDEPISLGARVKDFLPSPEELRRRMKKPAAVRVEYNTAADTLRLSVSDQDVVDRDRSNRGIVIEYDRLGKVVGLEVLKASRRPSNPKAIEFAIKD